MKQKNVKVCEPVEEMCDDTSLPRSVCWCDECIHDIEVPQLRKVLEDSKPEDFRCAICGGVLKDCLKTNWYYIGALLTGTLLVIAYSR